MHADRISNSTQIEWFQEFDTMAEKHILMANNFCCNFQDGLRPLFKASRQPVCRLQSLRNIGLVCFRLQIGGYARRIGLIDKYPRQRIRIQLHKPRTV